MNSEISIPSFLLQYCQETVRFYTPLQRYSGFQETEQQRRGDGDLTDLIGSLMVYNLLASANRVCRLELCCGVGDKSDLSIRIQDSWKSLNIKTSTYSPYREGLNLYIKEEEVDKSIDAYCQIFVHLNEVGFEPHIHLAGWLSKGSPRWNEYKTIGTIPNTGGHQGMKIPIEKLGSFESLVRKIDKKF